MNLDVDAKHVEENYFLIGSFHYTQDNNSTKNLQACLSFGLQNRKIDKLIFGVDSAEQLKQIIKIIKHNKINFKFPIFKSANKQLIDPRIWVYR